MLIPVTHFSRILLLSHSQGLSETSCSNCLISYSRCFADPFLRERREHKSNSPPPRAQSDPLKGLLTLSLPSEGFHGKAPEQTAYLCAGSSFLCRGAGHRMVLHSLPHFLLFRPGTIQKHQVKARMPSLTIFTHLRSPIAIYMQTCVGQIIE